MRLGAYTYLLKPFQREELKRIVEKALHTRSLELENLRLRKLLGRRGPVPSLVHKSQVMNQLVKDLQRVAPNDATALMSGESGTGKELAARALHDLSERWQKPFVAVNCGAIPAELMEAELFGHAKGTLPPLRERNGDVLLLWEHFTRLHAGEDLTSEPDLLAELERRSWRGNVRELRNLNQRMVLLRSGDHLTLADLRRLDSAGGGAGRPGSWSADMPADYGGALPRGPLPPGGMSLIELEKKVIRRALGLCDGNRTKTAEYLGIPRHVLVYRWSKYGQGVSR